MGSSAVFASPQGTYPVHISTQTSILNELRALAPSEEFRKAPARLLLNTTFKTAIFNENIRYDFECFYKSLGATLTRTSLKDLPEEAQRQWWNNDVQQLTTPLADHEKTVFVLRFDKAQFDHLSEDLLVGEIGFLRALDYSIALKNKKDVYYRGKFFPYRYTNETHTTFIIPPPNLLSTMIEGLYGQVTVRPRFGFGVASTEEILADLQNAQRVVALHLPNSPHNLTNAHFYTGIAQTSAYLHDLLHLHELLLHSPRQIEIISTVAQILYRLKERAAYTAKHEHGATNQRVSAVAAQALEHLCIEIAEGQFPLISQTCPPQQGTTICIETFSRSFIGEYLNARTRAHLPKIERRRDIEMRVLTTILSTASTSFEEAGLCPSSPRQVSLR